MAQNHELGNLLMNIIRHDPETFIKTAMDYNFNQIRMERIFSEMGISYTKYKNKVKYEEALDYAYK